MTIKKPKRGYTRGFRPHGETGKRYTLDEIPAGFWSDVRAQAAVEGESMRGLILNLLKGWLEDAPARAKAKAS